MNKLKFIYLGMLLSIMGKGLYATEEADKNILHNALIYKYTNDEKENAEYMRHKEKFTPKQLTEEFSKLGAIHVNLIETEANDSVLADLIPYAPFIYGLSLSDNYLTNEALNDLAKFTELRYLDLANNSFNFPSLDGLLALSHLQHLDASYNNIKSSELDNLKRKLENLQIDF